MEKIIVFFGPSGSGKGEARKHVLSAFSSQLEFSVSDANRGTPKSEIYRIWDLGKTPVLDVDVYGAQSVKTIFPEETFRIFLKPVSWDLWYEKLSQRHLKDGGSLADLDFIQRIMKASPEARLAEKFGYEVRVINHYNDFFFNEVENVVYRFIGAPLFR